MTDIMYRGPSWFGLRPICNAPEGTMTDLPRVDGKGEPLRLELLQRGGHFKKGRTVYVFCAAEDGTRVRLEAVCPRLPSDDMVYKVSL